MQQQYNEIKSEYPTEIVMFRLGDFYECFEQDAITVSEILGITLTGRGKGESRIPMAGIPFHSLDNYLPKLIQANQKIVLVEQLEDAAPGKLVKRGVTKVITPGTVSDENVLSGSQNNFLLSLVDNNLPDSNYGVAYTDISTGKIEFIELSNDSELTTEISRISPAEIITTQEISTRFQLGKDYSVTIKQDDYFDLSVAHNSIKAILKVDSLRGIGLELKTLAASATGALLKYVKECQLSDLDHFSRVSEYSKAQFMRLGIDAINHLELIYPSTNSKQSHSLFDVLNKCHTNMGKRLLRNWILYPLTDSDQLQDRWDAVDYFMKNPVITNSLRDSLRTISDIERLVGKVGNRSANPRDLIQISESLHVVSEITNIEEFNNVSKLVSSGLASVRELSALSDAVKLISDSINPEATANLTKPGFINTGLNQEVDELRSLRSGGKQVLAEIQARESEQTGIPSLKVSYNKVFGYYIEVTKTHSHKVPDTYIRKQTLTNAERYITEELKTWEEKILTAEDKLLSLEQQLYSELLEKLVEYIPELLQISDQIALIDVLSNFGYLARERQYSKPTLSGSPKDLIIESGRHPVVEASQSQFTPNDTTLQDGNFFEIITGPNMSGKSTFIRQVAILTLMAQIGSFVPATSMKFSIVDQIFTRVGASDNLSQGESTFMVEMIETANILNNATDRSLIILDEVGRGTSTYDGVALAWAVVEFIVEDIGARSLFATHYHELIDLENKYSQVSNSFVQVRESGGDILFMHKILAGSTDKSYGVHVAKLAGVPPKVVSRAGEILEQFSTPTTSVSDVKTAKNKQKSPSKPKGVSPQQIELL